MNMRKTPIVINCITVVGVLLVLLVAMLVRSSPPTELHDAFVEAMKKSDVAAVRRLSINSGAARIWETLQSGQIDKAESFFTRGGGWSGPMFSAQMTGYWDLTAKNKSGLSAPFRLELVRDGVLPWSPWRIKAVVLDATK